MNTRNLVASVMLYTENNTYLACYVFHIHQPILIFWQNIAVVFELSSAYLIYHVH